MKTLKILKEKGFNKISKDNAVWYKEIVLNGNKFTCVVVNGEQEKHFIEIKKLIGKPDKQYVQVPITLWEAFYELIEKVQSNTY